MRCYMYSGKFNCFSIEFYTIHAGKQGSDGPESSMVGLEGVPNQSNASESKLAGEGTKDSPLHEDGGASKLGETISTQAWSWTGVGEG